MDMTVQAQILLLRSIFPEFKVPDTESPWFFNVECGGGLGFQVDLRERGKYAISGLWPKNKAGQSFSPDSSEAPAIKVSRDRPVEQIRKDFYRRFWDAYKASYADRKADADASDLAAEAKKVASIRLAEALGSPYNSETGRVYSDTRDGIWGVQVNYEGTQVSLNIRYIPVELGLKIIRLLRESPIK